MNIRLILKMSCMLLFVLLSVDSWAQSGKSTLQLVQDKVWMLQLPPDKKYYVEEKYTDREHIITFITNGETIKDSIPYYLGDMFQGCYDSKLEGKVAEGRTIISLKGREGVKALKNSPTGVLIAGDPMLIAYFTILEISNTTLKIETNNGSVLEYKAK